METFHLYISNRLEIMGLVIYLGKLRSGRYPYGLNQNAGQPISVDPVSAVFAAYH